MSKKLLRVILGIVFTAIGIAGLLLPFLPGWLFFILAAVMFFPDHPRLVALVCKMKPKMPRFVRFLQWIGVGQCEEPHESPLTL